MRQAFVGSDSGISTNGTSIAGLNFPSNVRPGDWALLFWILATTMTISTDAAGFSLEHSSDTSGTARNRFYSKKCDGSESGAGITLETTTGNRMTACLAVYRGFHGIDAIDNFSTFDETATTDIHASPAIVPNNPDCALVTAILERVGTPTSTWGVPSGHTKRTEGFDTGTGGTSCCISDDGLNTYRKAVSVTPGNWDGIASTANTLSITIALRPIQFSGWGTPL